MIIVTSYDSPDLDGVSCSIAYAELLARLGKDTKATFYGELGLEVEFVKNFTNFFPIIEHKGDYDANDRFVLVDTADPEAIEPAISTERVIEIFDHRQKVYLDRFINSKNKIELVGSCATLITEEFQKNHINPATNTAIYLYSAIISNTINFKNSVTTNRDIDAATWLKSMINIPSDYVKQMFTAKSSITSNNLYHVLNQDFAVKKIGGVRLGIAQIEITDLEKNLNNLKELLSETMLRLKKENKLDYIFFSGIDIVEGINIFNTIDQESTTLFSKALNIPELIPGYKTDSIIMRKQIWPKIETVLSN